MKTTFIKEFLYDRIGNPKFSVFKSWPFWLGVSLKLILSVFFASNYLSNLFSPFVNQFLSHGGNPYEYFLTNGQGNEFPYPPLMLFILSAGRAITSLFVYPETGVFGWADSVGIRLPLLVADVLILLVLLRWFKTRQKAVIILYWFSPITIYISFIHGQLDVIPMAFLVVSLHFLFRRKLVWSALMFALALGCKTHLVLVLPFYTWYLYRNSESIWRDVLRTLSIIIGVVGLINLPFWGDSYIQMVYQNKVQMQVFDLFYQFNNQLKIHFIPAIFLLSLGWHLSFKFVNKDQLILFIGFVFLTLTLMIAPMQGWYYWILPFMVFYILRQGTSSDIGIFVLINCFYFLYFLLTPNSDFGRLRNFDGSNIFNPKQISLFYSATTLNLVFTFLQTSLMVFAIKVYRYGIRNNIQTKFLSIPYLVGIGGDSASGKSTLSKALVKLFSDRNAGIVRGDDTHKWERGDIHWSHLTHLNPEANRLHENMKQTIRLKLGKGINRKIYDHSTGKFTLPTFIKPKKLILFEGLHSFFLKNQADVYDLKIFMSPEDELRKYWKIQRDVVARGYDEAKVLQQIELRKEDSEKFIQSQAQFADIQFNFYLINKSLISQKDFLPEIGLEVRLMNNIYIDSLTNRLSESVDLRITQQYSGDIRIINFEGTINKDFIDRIAIDEVSELEEVGIYLPEWEDGYSGIMQLITSFVIFDKLKEHEG